ncbi:MAG: putative toxin-antitoxin system toxin component, PIN family [Acidobacteria bacterium]|nr:putative toxin-antitoxin system toxin component, PIN family [Acidobacteriota bacterium]
MRVVVDTNVFVSGVFFGGAPRNVLSAWRDGVIDVLVSREIVAEYVRVGDRLSRQFPDVELGPALELVAAAARLVVAPPLPEAVCRDADDDKFLACAVAGKAKYVVSGDLDFLAVSSWRGVTVVRPRDLVNRLRRD